MLTLACFKKRGGGGGRGLKGAISCREKVLNPNLVKNVKQRKAVLELGLINIWRVCHVAPRSGMKKRIRKQVQREMHLPLTLTLSLSFRGIWPREVDADQLTLSDRPVLP